MTARSAKVATPDAFVTAVVVLPEVSAPVPETVCNATSTVTPETGLPSGPTIVTAGAGVICAFVVVAVGCSVTSIAP